MKETILFIITLLLAGLTGAYLSCSAGQSKLSQCLDAGQSWSLLGTKTPDSAWLDKCARYHREDLVDKFCMNHDEDGNPTEYEEGCWDENENMFKYIERGP